MRRTTILLFIITILAMLTLNSCKFFLSPIDPRENPNDPANPVPSVFEFRAYGSGPASIDIKWRFDPDAGSVSDVIIIRNNAGPPTSRNDGSVVFEGTPETSEGDYYTFTDDTVETDSDYYYGIWSYIGEENDRVYNGPIIDEASTKPQTADITAVYDGYVRAVLPSSFFWDDIEIMMGLQYDPAGTSYYSLVVFDLSDAPEDIVLESAVLSLYFNYTFGTSDFEVSAARILQPWDTADAQILHDQIIANSFRDFSDDVNAPVTLVPHDANDYYYWDVSGTADAWFSGGEPNYGLLIRSRTIFPSDYWEIRTSDWSVYSEHPRLIINYYGDPPTASSSSGAP